MKAIDIKQLAEKISLGQSTIYRTIANCDFPKLFSLEGNRTTWIEDDITSG
jgi:prophage regulatory protein